MKRYTSIFLLLLPPLLGRAQALTNAGAAITVQSGTVLYVAGTVQNASGGTLTNAGTLQLTGDLTNAGALASTGTLLFSGATDQAFAPGAATLTNLTLANTGAAGSNRLFISSDLAVSNLLTLGGGLVRTQAPGAGAPLYTLSLPDGARVVGEGAGQYVQGRLAVTRAAVSTGAVDFTNGLVLNPNGQSLGSVTVTRTAGLQQASVSYGTNVGGTTKGIDRVWRVVATQSPSPATPASVTLSWLSDDDNGFVPGTPAQLWRAETAAGPWASQGAPASASARSLTANVTQLGVLTVSNTTAPLPVQLVSFTAQRLGADGLLQWQTASELKNDHFVVESSADGTSFQAVGQVAGAGTSPQPHSYQFTDKNLARYAVGQVYYRLRQVDTDGTATYSPVRTVAVPLAAGLLVQAYPNPSAPAQGITLAIRTDQAGPLTWQLTDVLGRLLSQQRAHLGVGAATLPLEASGSLPTGVYLLRVQQGGQQQTLKLVRQ